MVRWWHAAAVFGVIGPADAADLSLERIMLSSGGVGYFEYEATVDGNATLNLDVPLDQVDDILKSLVVYDDSGTAGEITLPGREPLNQSFVDLPFDQAALDSAPALLNALQGAEVRVSGAKPMSGRLLRVVEETARGIDGLAISRNRVTLATDAGIEQFVLEDAGSIAFTDPELQKKVSTALSRFASHRSEGRRRLTLESHGSGKRAIRVGYVVGVPLWKASYRLSLPAEPHADHARLQGWAILENFSGQDWHDVSLTLLSGNPVTSARRCSRATTSSDQTFRSKWLAGFCQAPTRAASRARSQPGAPRDLCLSESGRPRQLLVPPQKRWRHRSPLRPLQRRSKPLKRRKA
jgi:hypothetical protein